MGEKSDVTASLQSERNNGRLGEEYREPERKQHLYQKPFPFRFLTF